VRRTPLLVLAAVALAAGLVTAPGALAQDPEPPATSEPTTTTTAPPATTTPTTPPPPDVTVPPPTEDTTTTTAPPADDPAAGEELPTEPVPIVPDTVPPRPADGSAYAADASRLIRRELRVAEAEAVQLETAYAEAKDRVVALEAELDELELSITSLADDERAAVRRVEVARRAFEARAANAVVRGGLDSFTRYIVTEDPNEIAVANTLLDSVLAADQDAVAEYLAAKADVDADLVRTAERLVDARLQLEGARGALVDARRANVAAKFNLAVFAAGSEIAIHGFVFPVGEPHSFIDSFGFPRMMGTGYEHAHQGTDIMAPAGTPLLACERGIVTRMGSDVLGGTKIWIKGESGTYYYYAHLSAFAEGMHDGLVVEAGTVIGYVGDTGNAKGGAPHLHFEIRPDGGPAVNPYPLLKVVDDLNKQAAARR
jgi:murein DD-endopeptidase MepM/ murein hydrolase activator NlpD